MSETSHISIAALVSENERPAVQLAAGHIARVLSQAAGVPWTCDCVFSADMQALRQESNAGIIVTSLLPELGQSDEVWPQAEQRLRTAYTSLCEPGTPVFICTILRHVGHEEEPDAVDALRIRIRRLNLLAAEISRETGAYVIDLDRVLADIGARWLQTDYRLGGNAVAEMAGHFMALTLINNGFDALIPFEIQDAARVILASSRPSVGEGENGKRDLMIRKDLRPMGQGRRKQTVLPVVYTDPDVYAEWFMWQVWAGKIGPAEVFQRLRQAVRQHGVRGSTALVASALSRQLHRRK